MVLADDTIYRNPEVYLSGIRHKMFLSHSYDHRIIDGGLGGMFVKRVAEYLETFDIKNLCPSKLLGRESPCKPLQRDSCKRERIV